MTMTVTTSHRLNRIANLLGKLASMDGLNRRVFADLSRTAQIAQWDDDKLAAVGTAKRRDQMSARLAHSTVVEDAIRTVDGADTPVSKSDWDRVVEHLAALGVTGNWHSIGTAKSAHDMLRSYITYLAMKARHPGSTVYDAAIEQWAGILAGHGIAA
jgi:hypothetical protein